MTHPLKAFRKRKQMTLVQLSAQLDVSQGIISEWENYKKFPRLPQILKVMQATNGKVTANDFVPHD